MASWGVGMTGWGLGAGGDAQTMEEMLNETVLTNTLTRLRDGEAPNMTSTFIETKG